MFNPTRDEARDFLFETWRKHRAGELLTPLEDLARQLMADYRRDKHRGMAEIDAILSTPVRPPAQPGSFCKTPRNAQCPCGSGQKHKRCCGRNAPPMQKAA